MPEGEGAFGDRPVVGSVVEDGAILHMRSSSLNAWRPVLRVRWEPKGTGTAMDCRLGMGRGGIVSVAVLIGGAALAWLAAIAQSFMRGFDASDRLGAFFGPPGLIAVFVGMAVLGRYMAMGDDELLLDFVAETIGAKPAE